MPTPEKGDIVLYDRNVDFPFNPTTFETANYLRKICNELTPVKFIIDEGAFTQSGDLYVCTITDDIVTSNSSVWLDISEDSMSVAETAGIKSYITTEDGLFTIYADSKPTGDIMGSYIVFGGA